MIRWVCDSPLESSSGKMRAGRKVSQNIAEKNKRQGTHSNKLLMVNNADVRGECQVANGVDGG